MESTLSRFPRFEMSVDIVLQGVSMMTDPTPMTTRLVLDTRPHDLEAACCPHCGEARLIERVTITRWFCQVCGRAWDEPSRRRDGREIPEDGGRRRPTSPCEAWRFPDRCRAPLIERL